MTDGVTKKANQSQLLDFGLSIKECWVSKSTNYNSEV